MPPQLALRRPTSTFFDKRRDPKKIAPHCLCVRRVIHRAALDVPTVDSTAISMDQGSRSASPGSARISMSPAAQSALIDERRQALIKSAISAAGCEFCS